MPVVKFGVTDCADAAKGEISNNRRRRFIVIQNPTLLLYRPMDIENKEAPEKVDELTTKKPVKEVSEDPEERFALLATFIRLGILVWAGGILTLTYVTIPWLPQQKIDPTFIASVFTSTLTTFGVQAAKSNKEK